jgi:hypothetical protein
LSDESSAPRQALARYNEFGLQGVQHIRGVIYADPYPPWTLVSQKQCACKLRDCTLSQMPINFFLADVKAIATGGNF